jgi:recombination protein RecT
MQQQVAERTQQQQQPSPIMLFRERLIARRGELEAALEGSGIGPDRFIRTAITAVQTQPELVTDVSFQSLWTALLQACRDRLLPNGVQGAIVPFKRQAKWIAMYRGMLDRFEQSGHYKWVTADHHREDDKAFDVWVDEHGQHFLHRPGPREGKIIETYAAAMTKSGAFFVTVVSETEMMRIKNASRARSEDSPWQTWPDQMRLKSALRRLFKLLPTPQPLDEFVRRDLGEEDDDDETGAPAAPAARSLPRARSGSEALQQFAGDEPEQERRTPAEPPAPPDLTAGKPPTEETELSEPPADAPGVARIYLETAHERGREAKRQGHQRRAMPPEYRDPDRAREAIAWRRGFDGEPLDQ